MNVLNKKLVHYKVSAGAEAIAAIRYKSPDVLIAVGDDAQEFAAKFFLNKAKPRVVFVGVRGNVESFGYTTGKNVAGINNTNHLEDLETLVVKMMKNKKSLKGGKIKLGHIGDQSSITKIVEKDLLAYPWENIEVVDSLTVNTTPDFKKAIQHLVDACDVIIISNYRSINKGYDDDLTAHSSELMKLATTLSGKPIVSVFGYAVEEGADIALLSSAYEQGRVAIEFALKMIHQPSLFPVENAKILSIYMNQKRTQKTEVSVPMVHQSMAYNTNKFYE